MRIRRLRHELTGNGFRQSTVDLEYDDGSAEELWFRVPEETPIPASGNAWLAAALPLAAVLGEDLSADMPVDPWLKQNAETLVAVWGHWHPERVKPIRIHAETTAPSSPQPGVISMFTAGIDSFFTVLRHPECRHYLNVLGFDTPLWKQDAYDRLTARLERAASELGARLLRMATNLRETRWGRLPWEGYASGAALGGALLQLEEFRRRADSLVGALARGPLGHSSADGPVVLVLYDAAPA